MAEYLSACSLTESSPLAFHKYTSPQDSSATYLCAIFTLRNTVWEGLCVHQADFSKAAASHPKRAHALFIFIYTTSYLLIMGSSHFHYCSLYDERTGAHYAEIHWSSVIKVG